MRSVFRIGISVLCLLACAAVCVLWGRSSRYSDYAGKVTASRHVVLMTFPGGVKVATWGAPQEQPGAWTFASYEYEVRNAYGAWMSRPAVSWAKFGFDLQEVRFSNRPGPEPGGFELFVPSWFLVVALSLPPALMAFRWAIRRRRVRENCCRACGYDLRATPGRCPECGTVPAAALG